MSLWREIASILALCLLFIVTFAAGFYRGEASTMDKRMEAYEQGKRDGYWDAWQNDPEGVKPQEGWSTVAFHVDIPKEVH